MLSAADAETLIHEFTSSRLDYCNALFLGLPNSTTRSLQLVQNAAAMLISREFFLALVGACVNIWPVKPFETVMVIKCYTNKIELN